MKLNSKAFGKAFGLFVGGAWFLAMGFSLLTGIGVRTITTLGAFHPWFSYSWGGLAWMVAGHLVGGALLGWAFAELYNKLAE